MPHHHDHSHSSAQSLNTAFAIAILLNFIFTLTQIFYAFRAHSMSLMADALHNFGDVFGLTLAWGASWLMTRPARKRYSYGYKKISILAALTNAILLSATAAIIATESIYKLLYLSPVNAKIVLVVAMIGIVINGGTALLFMKDAHHDLNIKGAFLHLIADALISIGVVFAALIILWTKKMWVDPLIGLLIVSIIVWGTWSLLRDSVRLILDAIPHHIDYKGIEHFLQTYPGVKDVHDLHIWGLSTKEIALTAHLVMPDATLTDAEYKAINALLKSKFRIDHATIQVEKGTEADFCERKDTC